MQTLHELSGETALVTGAASNIGRAIATLFAREGARVLLADVDAARLASVAAELRAEGHEVSAQVCDLAQPDAAEALARDAIDRLGKVSLFVHSAAPARREADRVLDVSAETFDRMMSVNARSGFLLGRALARHMREQQIPGRMVYITSLHASVPRTLAHYSAAKAAQTMIVKELALALAPDRIRVNAVAPGAVMGGGFSPSPAQQAALIAKIPMGRTGNPDEVAQAALFLVLERFSSYVTGSTLQVDGGLALHSWIDNTAG